MELKWNKNGNWLLTASRDHLIKLFDIRNMKEEMQTFKGHKKEATCKFNMINILPFYTPLSNFSIFQFQNNMSMFVRGHLFSGHYKNVIF